MALHHTTNRRAGHDVPRPPEWRSLLRLRAWGQDCAATAGGWRLRQVSGAVLARSKCPFGRVSHLNPWSAGNAGSGRCTGRHCVRRQDRSLHCDRPCQRLNQCASVPVPYSGAFDELSVRSDTHRRRQFEKAADRALPAERARLASAQGPLRCHCRN